MVEVGQGERPCAGHRATVRTMCTISRPCCLLIVAHGVFSNRLPLAWPKGNSAINIKKSEGESKFFEIVPYEQ